MRLFWDLLQQNEFDPQKGKAEYIRECAARLISELNETKCLRLNTLNILEENPGKILMKMG
jgi:hypothetical protein